MGKAKNDTEAIYNWIHDKARILEKVLNRRDPKEKAYTYYEGQLNAYKRLLVEIEENLPFV